MEFHISRAVREAAQVDDVLFSYNGNIVFANVTASRKLAEALNKARPQGTKGIYLKKISVSSTMGAGVRVDTSTLAQAAPA